MDHYHGEHDASPGEVRIDLPPITHEAEATPHIVSTEWIAPEGRAYAGCPTCGMVTTVVNDGTPTDLPWCIHHDNTVVWRSGSAESGWTPMVLVAVGDAH